MTDPTQARTESPFDPQVVAVAQEFTAFCKAGNLDGAQQLWAHDVVSLEAFPSQFQRAEGADAVRAKQAHWSQGTAIHAISCEGPHIHGDQFALTFVLDATDASGARQTMREVAVYSVRAGKVVEERFFPLVG